LAISILTQPHKNISRLQHETSKSAKL